MPYVNENSKDCVQHGHLCGDAGELTFAIQQVIQQHLEWYKRPLKYEDLALVLGALEGAKADFVRRIVNPYEKIKQKENGDVWSKKILKKLTLTK